MEHRTNRLTAGVENTLNIKLGSLERDVLEFMRASGEATVPVASKAIVVTRPRSLASVGVVLKRLAAKGFLARIKDEKGLRYRATRRLERSFATGGRAVGR